MTALLSKLPDAGQPGYLFLAIENSRQYYQNCYIEGTTDFISGSSTAVFERCTIFSKTNSCITAASTWPRQKFGLVFLSCNLTASSKPPKVYLGRPWRPHACNVFLRTEMGPHIRPEGWENWGKASNEATTYYAEFASISSGANPQARVKWPHKLTTKEAKQYTLKTTLKGVDNWEPIRK